MANTNKHGAAALEPLAVAGQRGLACQFSAAIALLLLVAGCSGDTAVASTDEGAASGEPAAEDGTESVDTDGQEGNSDGEEPTAPDDGDGDTPTDPAGDAPGTPETDTETGSDADTTESADEEQGEGENAEVDPVSTDPSEMEMEMEMEGGGEGEVTDPQPAEVQYTADFRVDDLSITSPGFFAFGALPVTDTVEGEIDPAVDNGELNLLLRMDRTDVSSPDGDLQLITGACESAAGPCGPGATDPIDASYTNQQEGNCLEELGQSVAAPCFVTAPRPMTIVLEGLLDLPLQEARLSMRYVNDPVDGLDGYLHGFMTRTDADATPLPMDLALVGGMPLSNMLRDQDASAWNGQEGWWVLFDLHAGQTTFNEP